MSRLVPMLTEYAFVVFLGLFVVTSVVERTIDAVLAARLKRRQRAGSRSFPVLARRALPYDADGPGVYHVEGVLERTGTPTRFDVDARSAADARGKALERGVSPGAITKRPQLQQHQQHRRDAA